MEPGIWADALNKFSQLTPWVQAVALALLSITVLGTVYYIKEIVAVIARRAKNANADKC